MSEENKTIHVEPATDAEVEVGKAILEAARQRVDNLRKGTARVQMLDSGGRPLDGVVVKIIQKSQDFLFGNLAFDLVWEDRLYKPDLFKRRFLELFNMAIFPFYWSSYERAPGKVEWQRLLPALEWCQVNGVTPKGHPLVWPYSAGIPEWLYEMPPESVECLIHARVSQIVKGFQPVVNIWDVTNEAVNHISWEEATHTSFRDRYHEVDLWRGIPVAGAFKKEIPIPKAADWVEKSFRWAYAANPAATLIVNDYNQEIDLNVRQRFFDLIRELQRRSVPVSGIGLQVHPLNHWIWPQQIQETLDMYAELDIPVHITELHQPAWDQEIEGGWRGGMVIPGETHSSASTWTEEAQAEFIEQLYRQFFGHPSVVSINYWGLSDRNIWIPGAGLVDAEYQPKPVFTRLKELIKGEWITTPFTLQTDEEGRFEFRGFFGSYDILLERAEQRTRTYKMHLAEKEGNFRVFHT